MCKSTSAIRKVPGSEARTKAPICCYDNTSLEVPTCLAIRKRSSSDERTSLCWWSILSIATRGKPASISRVSRREHIKYFSHILGPETYANYRTLSNDL